MMRSAVQNLILGSMTVLLASCGFASGLFGKQGGTSSTAAAVTEKGPTPAATLGCTLTPSQPTVNSNELQAAVGSVTLVGTGKLTSVTFDGAPVPITFNDAVFTNVFPVTPTATTTYTATVSDGKKTASCSATIQVVNIPGPVCQIEATTSSLTITVSESVGTATLEVTIPNENNTNQFSLSPSTNPSFTNPPFNPGSNQALAVSFSDSGCDVMIGCCGTSIQINNPADGVLLTVQITDAATGNPGPSCSTFLP